MNMEDTPSPIPGFRAVPRTGVIYVMHRAAERGFCYGHADWANLGQGSPETGALESAPPRIQTVTATARGYSPVAGDRQLRQCVADLYNTLFRQGKRSQYTYENVSIAGGGRLSLTRLVAALDNVNMGHFLPDYTAYEELLSTFKSFVPIPILLKSQDDYRVSAEELRQEILGRGLAAVLISNPTNPTGHVIQDAALASLVDMARETQCTLITDEHYSHFVYRDTDNPHGIVTAAEYVDDVNRDPLVVIDGLTKNWRYPGFRISWTLGPKSLIETISSAGSFLDGGANHPFQSEVPRLLQPDYVLEETAAIRQIFQAKRDYLMDRLQRIGIRVDASPDGAFYLWANLEELPSPLNNGLSFFEEGLDEQLITVPGVFFDVNPGQRRRHSARYANYARISYGPEMATLQRGAEAIERLVARYR